MKLSVRTLFPALALTAGAICAQSQSPQIVKVDKVVSKEIADSISKKFEGEQIKRCEALINNAFDEYFGQKSNIVTVSDRSEIDKIDQDIKDVGAEISTLKNDNLNLQNKIDSLNQIDRKSNNQLEIEKKEKEWRDKLEEKQKSVEGLEGSLTAKNTELDNLISISTNKAEEFAKLQEEIEKLKNNQKDFAEVLNQYGKFGASLSEIYQNIYSLPLGDIDTEEVRDAVRNISNSGSNKKDKFEDQIDIICQAAIYYKKAREVIAGKYDSKSIKGLIFPIVKSELSDAQKAELTETRRLVNQYPALISHFKDRILEDMYDEKAIPEDEIERISMLINLDVEDYYLINDIPYDQSGHFEDCYKNLNEVLKELQDGVKDGKKNGFSNPEAFQEFLNDVETKL